MTLRRRIASDINTPTSSTSRRTSSPVRAPALCGDPQCFSDLGLYHPADVIHWMLDRQDAELARLGLPFRGLVGRPLHAIDGRGPFCETDEYGRQAVPELASERKRITHASPRR
ncbi:MAG: putative DNA base hypermodification protein [Micromonosporaceae bacterium]